MKEQLLQESFVRYISLKYPSTRYCASLGGIRTTMKQAVKAKQGGYVKGMPDMQIMSARGGFHGLFIELKTDKGRASKHQNEWINDLIAAGYYAEICKGIDQAMDCLDSYMKLKQTKVCAC
tara:strand:+ start:1950 stop:2312 length:363 start_codon:yes stop_codon:yes gene_type:complete